MIKLFQKFAVSKGRALVARRNERNLLFGVSLLRTFLFAPFVPKRKVDIKVISCKVYKNIFDFYKKISFSCNISEFLATYCIDEHFGGGL